MPPRSYYNEPRPSDYIAYAKAFFPEDYKIAAGFANNSGLPYISSSAHIAAYLGVSPSLIRQIIHKPSYHYREFEVKKATGETRLISTPKTYLKVVQWWICDNILEKIVFSECVHGFRKGRSYVTNANVHKNSRHILNVDVRSFFDSIKISQIANVFAALGYPEGGSLTLASLTSKDGVAPTGAPTSPMIANAIFKAADEELLEFAQNANLIYTRYADDLTFSGMSWIDEIIVEKVAEIVKRHGFELNEKKTKFMGPGDRKEVTGVVTNNGLNMPREWRNWARGYLHNIKLSPRENLAEIDKVRGVYGILTQFDVSKEKKLTRLAEEAMESLKQAQQK